MDDSAFDTLTRSFTLPSRRSLFSALGVAIFPALFDQDGAEDALATGKHGKRRNRGQDAAAVQASGKKRKKKGKGKKKKGGKRPGPVCTDALGIEGACEPRACEASDCTGCCGADGLCKDGLSKNACGPFFSGRPCEVCQDEQVCAPDGCAWPCGEDGAFCGNGNDIRHECCEGFYCNRSSQTCICQGRGDECDEQTPCCNGAECEARLVGPGDVVHTCSRHCRYWGCFSGSTCCESTGECFSTTWTNCRHPNGSLFYCNNPCCQVCCVSPSRNNAGCGSGCVEEEGFHAAPPATCS